MKRTGLGFELRNLTRALEGRRGTRALARTFACLFFPSLLVRFDICLGLDIRRGMFFIQLVLAALYTGHQTRRRGIMANSLYGFRRCRSARLSVFLLQIFRTTTRRRKIS